MKNLNLLKTLEQCLKTDERFVENGELKKWVVINHAQNCDETLIKLLLAKPALKKAFFKKAGDVWIFNQFLFMRFLEQKNHLKDSYTKYRGDVGLSVGDEYLKARDEVALIWAHKDCVLEGGQNTEEQKRNEIFFNEILAQDEITQLLDPKVITRAALFNKKGKQKAVFTRDVELNKKRDLPEDTITDNLIIKGNNLLALHSLEKQFAGKVKLIYIDPPYNTGNDGFKYNDKFTHSTWLTFMKNRLETARELLKDDGVIFVQCDDNEMAYLKVLMDEVFGRENFIDTIIWKRKNRPQNDAKYLSANADFILLFAKVKDKWKPNLLKRTKEMNAMYKNIDNDQKGNWASMPIHAKSGNENSIYEIKFPNGIVWKPPLGSYPSFSKTKLLDLYNENKLIFKGNNVRRKVYVSDVQRGRVCTTVWDGLSSTIKAASEIQKLFNQKLFTTPKPEELIQRVLEIATQPGDITLDYHLGSGTTAAVAHKMGRQYIGVEQMDYIEPIAVERLKKVIAGEQGGISKAVEWKGDGSFIYMELKKYNQLFMDKIQNAQNTQIILKIWEEIESKSFINYNVDIKKHNAHIEEFKELSLEEQKQHLCELLDKNQLYVNLSSLNDGDYKCAEEEKDITQSFYQISPKNKI